MKVLPLIILLFVSIGLLGQESANTYVGAVVSPIPPFSDDVTILNATSKNHVFIDPRTSELVIVYSDNGVPITRRIPLRAHIDPFFKVTIGHEEDGNYIYSYVLRNGSRAQDRIVSWTMPVPREGDDHAGQQTVHALIAGNPSLWDSKEDTVVNAERRLKWVARSLEAGVGAGKEISGFSLRSRLRPGFVETYVSGGPGVNAAEFPENVAAELRRLEMSRLGGKTALILAPKFSPEATSIEIASDYYRGMRILSDNGYLDPEALFSTEALNILHDYLVSVSGETEILPQHYLGLNVKTVHAPTTDLEKQIYQAMKVAFESNAH
jgi:hypothetical protein